MQVLNLFFCNIGTIERISDGGVLYNTQFHHRLVDEPFNIPWAEV
jgi:hypothetical protein